MISRLYHIIGVIVLLILLVAGLNISNHSLNQLTMNSREPVIGLNFENDKVMVYFLGESYPYSMDKLAETDFSIETEEMFFATKNYFEKIWKIFKAVFLY